MELKPNYIVRGAIFPEPVKVIMTRPMGDAIMLIGEGMHSGRVHQPILTAEQIATLEVSTAKTPLTAIRPGSVLGWKRCVWAWLTNMTPISACQLPA